MVVAAEPPEQIPRGQRLDPRHGAAPGQPGRLFQRGPHALGRGIPLGLVHRPAPVELGLVEVLVVLAAQRQAMIDACDRRVELAASGLSVGGQRGVVREREPAPERGQAGGDRPDPRIVVGRPRLERRGVALVRGQAVLRAQGQDLGRHGADGAAVAGALLDGRPV